LATAFSRADKACTRLPDGEINPWSMWSWKRRADRPGGLPSALGHFDTERYI